MQTVSGREVWHAAAACGVTAATDVTVWAKVIANLGTATEAGVAAGAWPRSARCLKLDSGGVSCK